MSSSYRNDGKGKRWAAPHNLTGSQDRRESIRAPLLAKIQACYTFYGLALHFKADMRPDLGAPDP